MRLLKNLLILSGLLLAAFGPAILTIYVILHFIAKFW